MEELLDRVDVSDENLARMRIKYRQERDKRFRADGRKQYSLPQEVLGRLLEDPNARPINREPLHDEVDVIIIGGGYTGLLAGARLRKLGIEKIRIVDRAGDVGGTWYWNRYPGARCDIESYIYMPLLEETGYVPSEKFTTATELREHAQRIARHYGLYRDACFGTEVTRLEWDEEEARWIVHTMQRDRMRARFIFDAPGPLQRTHLPAIPGIADFKGRSFLTSRWDFDYTKGDVLGGLTGLSDKKVAIIGTGATAVQVIPLLAQDSEHLYVVQRTPTAVGPRPNPQTDREWTKSLEPGWQRRRMRNFVAITSGVPEEQDLVNDEWTRYFGGLHAAVAAASDPADKALAAERADLARDEYIRDHVDEVVEDAQIASALKHYFRYFCKRPTFSASYLQSFNRANVTLVDTDGRGLDRITEEGFVFAGTEYEVDCIVWASGFEADADYHTRSGFDIIGRGGVSLEDHWKDGARTFHSVNCHGFPNLFLLGAAHGGFYLNFINRVDQDVQLASYIMDHMLRHGKSVVEPTQQAEEAWVEEIRRLAIVDRDFMQSCTPGQYNNWGKEVSDIYIQNGGYGLGPVAWEDLLQAWREAGDLEGLAFQ